MRFDSGSSRVFLSAALAGALSACGSDGAPSDEGAGDDADEIAAALELENGGFTMEDEAPLFGDDDAFAAAELEAEADYDDPMDADPAVVADLGAPDGAIYHAAILWGQMPADLESDAAVDWSGTLSINRGALIIRRVIAFEDETDGVDPRTDRRAISFRSVTRPHADGFRLTVVDPRPESAEPLVLTYTPDDGAVYSVEIDALVDGPQSHVVDDLGNRLVAVAMREGADVCQSGLLRGRWHRVRDGRGRFLGVVTDAEGTPVGHVRGVYGRRRAGDPVFYGKFIDRVGRFRGLLGGTYGEGHFRGRWIDRGDPDRGVLAGEYRENERAAGVGGHFLGRWAETACDVRLER